MRTLKLRIENHTTLDNGGPVSLVLSGRGAQIGRKAGNDWVLPDPSRHISGHHLDIVVENGQYVLTDVSSNGTFLHGERYRIDGAHVIQDGDRFTIGHYIVKATLEAGVAEAAPPPVEAPQPGDEFDDVWGNIDTGPAAPERASPRSGLQSPPGAAPASGMQQPYGQSARTQQPDFRRLTQNGGGAITTPPPGIQQPNTQAPFASRTGVSSPPAFAQQPQAQAAPMAPPSPQAHQHPQNPPQPHYYPQNPPPQQQPMMASEGFGIAGNAPPPVPQNQGYDTPPAMSAGDSDAMMRGFIEGAGLNAMAKSGIPPEDLGRMLGKIARQGTQELMRMLQDRAAVKLFVSNEDRTMRVAAGNNPMKFMLDIDQAFEALFLTPRDGYLTGADGFENALKDVRKHQSAVIAAMQPALAEMLDGLSPEDIEKAVGGGMLGGGSRKAWDEFTKRWETRAEQGENGMLDAFIKSFSRHYSEALRKL